VVDAVCLPAGRDVDRSGGTTNLDTLTKFPGGTITAHDNHIALSHALIPIESGTGIFRGVTRHLGFPTTRSSGR